MKVDTKREFTPVTLTLETQEEIDAFFAILVHGPTNYAVGLQNKWQLLEPYRSDAYQKLVERLSKLS